MKNIVGLIIVLFVIYGCNATKPQKMETLSGQEFQECTDQNSCIELLNKIISSNWHIPNTYQEGMWAKVEISVDNDYNVSDVYILKNRGDRRFADSIERAILKSSPFSMLHNIKWSGDSSKIVLIFNPNPDFNIQNPAYELYQQGLDYIKLKELDKAILQFEMVYKEFPDTKYGINSQYWLGELYYANGNVSQAKKCFEIVSHVNDSPKRVDSLYKLGQILESNGDTKGAHAYFMKILKEYEGTVIARVTKEHMIKLGMDVDL